MAEAAAVAGEVIFRPAGSADAAATSRLTRRAFSASVVEERVEEPVDEPKSDQIHRPGGQLPSLSVVAEHHGQVVAVASATLRGQWFGGRRTLCAAVGGVAVGVEVRGLGVGRKLLTSLLAAAREAGATTSALFPSTQAFYAGLGYGIGGRRPVYELATAGLRSLAARREPTLWVRRARRSDSVAVARLVSLRAARGSGLLDHNGAEPDPAEDPTGPDSYVVEQGGVVRGWCALGRAEPATRSAKYDLVVHDLVAETADAERVLWGLLVADHPSSLRAEAVVMPGSLVEHLDSERTIVEDASWMFRLLDVDAVLAARGYPLGVTAELALRVDDPVCPWNQGTRVLSVAGGSARVRVVPATAAAVEVSAADLASLFTSHLDPAQARYEGRLRSADDAAVALIRTLFAGPPAWLARTF